MPGVAKPAWREGGREELTEDGEELRVFKDIRENIIEGEEKGSVNHEVKLK